MNKFITEIKETKNPKIISNFINGVTKKEKFRCKNREITIKNITKENFKEVFESLNKFDIIAGKAIKIKKDKSDSKTLFFGRCTPKQVIKEDIKYVFIPWSRTNDVCFTENNIKTMTLYIWKYIQFEQNHDWSEFEN